MFGGSVSVIYNRDLISSSSLTIIHSNIFYMWLKHDHKRAHKNSIKPIINSYYSFNDIIIIFHFSFLQNNYIIITYLLLCGLKKSCPLQYLALINCLLHRSSNPHHCPLPLVYPPHTQPSQPQHHLCHWFLIHCVDHHQTTCMSKRKAYE